MSFEYRYNFFLRTGLEIFLETFIITLLNIAHAEFTNFSKILSFTLSLIFIVILITFFLWSLQHSLKNYPKYKGKKYDISEYESMFGDYKTENLPQFLFNSFFMLRRMLFACIIIFLENYPPFQAFAFMIICVPFLAYHYVMNPYKSIVNNVIMNINETCFIFIGIFFYLFAEPNSDTEAVLTQGWCCIGILLGMIITNLTLIWIIKIKLTWKQIKQWLYPKPKITINEPSPASSIPTDNKINSTTNRDNAIVKSNQLFTEMISDKRLPTSHFLRFSTPNRDFYHH